MSTPTVLVIGGPPGAGKTTLGRAMAARLGAASLSVDDLMTALRVVTTPDSHPALFFMRAAGGHVEYFTQSPPARLVADAIELEQLSTPVVDAVVRSHLDRSEPAVLDWWLLDPDWVAGLGDERVAAVFLHPTAELLWHRERSTGFADPSDDPERMLANFVHRSLWRNEHLAAAARRLGLPVLEIAGTEPVDALVDEVLRRIAPAIRAQAGDTP